MPQGIETQLRDLGVQCIFLFLTGIGVYLLSKLLKLGYPTWTFANAKRSALWGLGYVAVLFLLLVLVLGLARPTSSAMPSGTPVEVRYDLSRLLNQLFGYLILTGPALLIMRVRHEPWASAGVSRLNLPGALLIGLLLGLVSVVTSDGLAAFGRGLSSSQLWALPCFGVVGLGEEFLFRGYLQTRLCAWLGQGWGWLLASVLMALLHIGQRVMIQGLSSVEALVSSALLIPISLFMGYVMLRTGNIVAPALCHTFADWVGVWA